MKVNNIGLGKRIYTQQQLDEFARFQDSQGTRKAYLAETAEMAYIGRNERGEWGLREMGKLVYEQPGNEVDGSCHSKEGSK